MENLLASLPLWLKGTAAATVALYLLGLFARSKAYGQVRKAWGLVCYKAGQGLSLAGSTRLGKLWQPLENILSDFLLFGAEQAGAGLRADNPEKLEAQVSRLVAVGSVTRAMALAEKLEQLRGDARDAVQEAAEAAGKTSIGSKLLPVLLLALFASATAQTGPTSLDKLRYPDTLTAAGDSLMVAGNGHGTVGFQLSGTWSGTVKFQATVDGTNWVPVKGFDATTRSGDTTTTANGIYILSTTGLRYVKARMHAYTSGSAYITAITTDDPGVVVTGTSSSGGGGAGSEVDILSIAAGNTNIGNVDIESGPTGSSSLQFQGPAAHDAVYAGNPVPMGGYGSSTAPTAASANGDAVRLWLDLNGRLQIGDGGGSLTVDNGGTFATQAAQSGIWTVQPGNTANTTAWLVTGTGGTFPITAAALPLPSGAATAAKQPALGTAGSASTDVLSVQGIASGTNLNVNVAADAGGGSTGSAVPSAAKYMGANSSGNLTGLIQADASVKIDVSTATTTQLVALTSSQKIYITSWDVIAAGTGTLKLVYGTGSNCGTGTTDLTGAYPLIANVGLTKGSGLGPVLVVPASNALCVTTSAAVAMTGSVSYTKF